MSKGVETVLAYAAEVSGVLAFPLAVVAAGAPTRKWIREHRSSGYRPRHARPGRWLRRGRHRLTPPT